MRIDLFVNVLFVSGCLVTFLSVLPGTAAAQPAGFISLFDGKDLRGWRGRPGGGGGFSPYVEAKFTPQERTAKQAERKRRSGLAMAGGLRQGRGWFRRKAGYQATAGDGLGVRVETE